MVAIDLNLHPRLPSQHVFSAEGGRRLSENFKSFAIHLGKQGHSTGLGKGAMIENYAAGASPEV